MLIRNCSTSSGFREQNCENNWYPKRVWESAGGMSSPTDGLGIPNLFGGTCWNPIFVGSEINDPQSNRSCISHPASFAFGGKNCYNSIRLALVLERVLGWISAYFPNCAVSFSASFSYAYEDKPDAAAG